MLLLLASTLALSFNIQPVGAIGTIYIRADGSIDPTDAPISTIDNITYTLTDNICNLGFSGAMVEIQRDSVVIDGANYALQGHEDWYCQGIFLSGRTNVTIRDLEIRFFNEGVWLSSCSNITICNNKMKNISNFAIDFDSLCSHNSVKENDIANAYGIRFGSACSYNSVLGNSIDSSGGYGIEIDYSSNNNICENNVTNCNDGIWLYASSNNSIHNNNIISNNFIGVRFYSSCSHNSVFENTIANNIGDGIRLYLSSNYNDIFGNRIESNGWDGIFLEESCDYNTLASNKIAGNSISGIFLYSSSRSVISWNNVTNNDYGIILGSSSDDNTIVGNNITDNSKGARLGSSSNNTFCHNLFTNNTQQVDIDPSWYSNSWDNGYPSGGNCWSDYAGPDEFKGLYQNETGSDGIGDTPYPINVNNTDHYPILHPWSDFRVHNLNTGLGYSTIQAAISAPETLADHIIFAEKGIYPEFVTVDKNNLTLVGESERDTIIENNGIRITSSNVAVTSFTIRNTLDTALFLDGSNNSIISGNIIANNDGGGICFAHASSNNTIIGNNVIHNRWDGGVGISLLGSSGSGNVIIENNITDNDCGISVSCSGNVISRNNVSANSAYGVGLWAGSNNTVTQNRIESSEVSYGIGLSTSSNTISKNNISMNVFCFGIWCFSGSCNNIITGNAVGNCQSGIKLDSSSNNSVYENTLSNNDKGIELREYETVPTTNNTIYHNNLIDNNLQAFCQYSEDHPNFWDNGYPSGGNYWSDYAGADYYSGNCQNEPYSDGIGDTPYVIETNSTDNYPLVAPWPSYDIAVLNLTTSKTGCKPMPTIGENCTASVDATIGNLGSYDENFTVVFYVGAAEIARENVSLASREHIVISFDLNTTGWTKGNYTVRLYIEPVSGEANTTNNLLEDSFLVTMLGDVNGDGKVDVKDVYATALAYGTSVDGPNPEGRKYNPNCDINNDLRVDVKDYYIVCKNYGRVDP